MVKTSEKIESAGEPASKAEAQSESSPAATEPPTGEPFEVAVVPLQNTTLFPETVVPLAVGRPRSVAAVEAALTTEEKLLGCITVRPGAASPDAKPADLYEVGTLVMVKRMERLEESMHIIAQGTERIRVLGWKQEEPYLRAVVRILPEVATLEAEEGEATRRNVQAMSQESLAL